MLMRVFDWAFRDRHTGRIIIAQWPNLWLWIFIVASLVEIAAGTVMPIGIGARIVAMLFLVIWAVKWPPNDLDTISHSRKG